MKKTQLAEKTELNPSELDNIIAGADRDFLGEACAYAAEQGIVMTEEMKEQLTENIKALNEFLATIPIS